jgi:peptidoglycan hydrolase-like protein with peptidoglycan-binding domain
VVVLASLAIGLTCGFLLVPPSTPASLGAEQPLKSVAVTQTSFDDPQDVSVTVVPGPSRTLTSAAGGRLTSFSCAVGSRMTSGTSAFSVDGAPILLLATGVPLWRDIRIGDRGDDVAALQTELTRLGFGANADGKWGARSQNAYESLLRKRGMRLDLSGRVSAERIAWLPSETAAVMNCAASVGDTVEPTQAIARFAAGLASATVVMGIGSGAKAQTGDRVIVVDDARIPLPADGRLTDQEALDTIANSFGYRQAMSGTDGGPGDQQPSIAFQAVLTTPLRVAVVPPSAVYGLEGDRGCVRQRGGSVPVSIVGSQLGETLIRSDHALSRVELNPRVTGGCGE